MPRNLGETAVRDDLEPAGRAQRRALSTQDKYLVTAIGAAHSLDQRLRPGEHLERTGDVETLNVREGEDRNLTGQRTLGHRSIMPERMPVCKDRFPTISAITQQQTSALPRSGTDGGRGAQHLALCPKRLHR